MTPLAYTSVFELFAGPGGMSEGLKIAGIDPTLTMGFEISQDACDTAEKAGHPRLLCDITTIDPREAAREYGWPTGVHGSPPCPGFSPAGKGLARKDTAVILEAIDRMDAGEDPKKVLTWLTSVAKHEGSALCLEPLHWALVLNPEWVTMEQVSTVLPLWEAVGQVLRRRGYSVWVGCLNAEQYGIVSPCAMHSQTVIAPSAANSSPLATGQVFARASATTQYDSDAIPLARTVVAHWAQATSRDAASLATWLAHEHSGAMRVESGKQMPTGAEVAEWTNEATSGFGLTAAIAESIAWSWNASLVDLSLVEKWSTMSTSARTTTIRATLSCIAATLTTGFVIGQETRADDCGLCLDAATPQTRKRAILLASRVRTVRPPVPTHSRFHSRSPERLDPGVLKWVSMAEALGWGMTQRPYVTIAAGTASGGADPQMLGGSGARAIVRREYDEGRWVDKGVGFPRRWDGGAGGVLVIDGEEYRARDLRSQDDPAFTITEKARSWNVYESEKPLKGLKQDEQTEVREALRVSTEDAAILQSFPPYYHFQGSRTSTFTQVGNAVPPLMGAAMANAVLR